MIQRVYEQCIACDSLSDVIVATDDERIESCVSGFGGKVEMTSVDHSNGTERCAEVARNYKADYFINIQGDEPFIHPEQISILANILDGKVELGTLVKKIKKAAHLNNPNSIKVILNNRKEAMYFSRSCVPFLRGYDKSDWIRYHQFYKHIGIYAYRSDVLENISQLPMGPLEKGESLEAIRWLENGYTIQTAETELETIGVNAPEDVQLVLKLKGLK